MKFLIDMNLSPLWVGFFDQNGYAAVHWSNIGNCDASDREIMKFASTHGYIVFTNDLDFGTLLAAHKTSGPSVIQVRSQEVLPLTIGEVVLRTIRVTQQHLENGALVTVDLVRQRIRLLPISDLT